MTNQTVLPDDQDQFKLNEVCKLANVQPYMLRFWGTEFPQLEAAKSGTGQRLYSRDQVVLILEIRRLLFDEGLTIAGAKRRIAAESRESSTQELAASSSDDTAPVTSAKEKPQERIPVDKPAPKRVERLVTTMRHLRKELTAIVDELENGGT